MRGGLVKAGIRSRRKGGGRVAGRPGCGGVEVAVGVGVMTIEDCRET